MSRMLMVVTGADHLTLKDGTSRPTGFWAEELIVPHQRFRAAGIVVEAATPGGVAAPVDPLSLVPEMNGGDSEMVQLYKQYLATIDDLKHPRALEAISKDEVASYSAVFLPGGHGPMEDLAHSKALGLILLRMQAGEKLIVAVCHGPAGLLTAIRPDGTWAFTGYRLTAFTNEEEKAVGLADKVPFLLETRLRELGGHFEAGKPGKPHVVADRQLVTGQNPASSGAIAEKALDLLRDVVPL